jgi:hypothetical protein
MSRFAALVVLVAAIAAGTASGTHRAAADSTQPSVWTDPAADSGSAPDVTNVTMTPGAGTVHVDVTFAGALGTDGDLILLIDADRNSATGHFGFDYLVDMEYDGYYDLKWNGSDWDDYAHQDLAATLSDTHMGLTVTLADIGGVTTFDWAVQSIRGSDHDLVPDGQVATYPVVVPPPTVKAVILPSAIFAARAGKLLRIAKLQVQLSDSTVAAVDSQTCTLSWKGSRLKAAAGCAWVIPKKAKGARLTLRVTYMYAGASHVVMWTVVPP